jgi:type IV secretory pathway VirB10-like protein
MPMPEEKQAPEMQATAQTAQPANAGVHDKRVLPEGVVPKQAQGYVVAGLALLILSAVLFSKNQQRAASQTAAPPTATLANDGNQGKIEELEQNLSADQRQSQQQAQRAATTGTSSVVPNAASAAPPRCAAAAAQLSAAATPTPAPDPVADAEKALAFKARFASNLVSTADDAPRSSEPQTNSAVAGRPTDAAQQMPAAQNVSAGMQKRAPEVNLNAAHGQPFVLFEGTTVDTVLTNRLDGDFAGPVKVMVSNPVYSHDGQHVLIPEGTFLLGETQKVSGFGQKRLAVTFHRMLMPDGYSVDLDQFHGLDQIGDMGLTDKVNHHYLQIFGTSMALGIISGASEATTSGGYNENGSDMYRQGVASSLSQSSTNVLDRFINVLPTITIREGHRIKVYLTQDMLLPAYENHDMPEAF